MTLMRFPTLFNDKDFDELFDSFFRPVRRGDTGSAERMPAMDITENEDHYLIHADMPGLNKEDISIEVHDGVLNLRGEHKEENTEKQDGKVIRRERRVGRYVRSLTVGETVNEDAIEASYKDGVLEVKLPKKVAPEPKKVQVTVA
jgi:HSP20 family protein